jgi:hypothetical protein
MATLLSENWGGVAADLDGLAGDQAYTGPSGLHGVGVFASRDLEAGELVTLYPVHRLLQTLGDGRGVATFSDETDERYFSPTLEVVDDEKVYRQVAYRQTYAHPDPERPESFQLDANANKPDVAGWLGHRLNDGATLSAHVTSEEELLRYYEQTASLCNVCAVALCVPLLGFVTTRAVAKAEELLATYGHGYWLQRLVAVSAAVDEAIFEPAKETVHWQIETDKRYADQIRSLDDFISRSTPDEVAAVAGSLRDGGDGALPATPSPLTANRSQRRKAAKTKGAVAVAEAKPGFGSGRASAPSKRSSSKKKR